MRFAPHFLVATLLVASPALAQPGKKPTAGKRALSPEEELKAAIALVDKDEDKAAAELDRIYAARKDPRALYPLAKARQKTDPAGALRAYERYLREDANVPTSRRAEILGAMQMLMDQIALVTVTASDESTIFVDETEVGTAPLKNPVYVNPGSHKITAKRGEQTATKPIDVEADARVTVDLSLDSKATAAPAPPPSSAAPAEPPPPAPAESKGTPIDWRVVGGYGAAVVLAGGAAYFALKANSTASNLSDKKKEFGVSRDELDAMQGDVRLQAGAATLLGLGAIGAAGYTYFVLGKPQAKPTTGTKPHVVFTGQGFVVRGGF